jgi:hypothetical protein
VLLELLRCLCDGIGVLHMQELERGDGKCQDGSFMNLESGPATGTSQFDSTGKMSTTTLLIVAQIGRTRSSTFDERRLTILTHSITS